ncbi:unnamed protein product, partial [Mesorhabditis belari]|uniref:C2H2-type domain-containing protein n=1 Tax=Mesorhabditis belari TaxID=2138241 RepID=A0AAF3FGP9_9BILA
MEDLRGLPNLAEILGLSVGNMEYEAPTLSPGSSSSEQKKRIGKKRKHRGSSSEGGDDGEKDSDQEGKDGDKIGKIGKLPKKDSDPEWSLGRENLEGRQQRSARKRGPQSYREADMFKQQIAQMTPPPPRPRNRLNVESKLAGYPGASIRAPASNPLQHPPATSLKAIIQRLEKPQEHEFLTSHPNLKALIPCPINRLSIPSSDKRIFIAEIELRPEFLSCSGGFRRFIKSITDQTLLQLLETLKVSWAVDGADDYAKLGQVMRIIWNMQSDATRMLWELEAREDCRLANKIELPRKAIVKEIGENIDEKGEEHPMEIDGENGECKENLGELGKGSTRATTEELTEEGESLMTKMPAAEQPLIANGQPGNHPDRMTLRCPTCKEASSDMHTFGELINHYLSHHFLGIHYGCHLCGQVFQSMTALNAHGCEQFNQYLLELLLVPGNKTNTLEMKYSFFFLSCSDCGLLFPISSKFDTNGQVSTFYAQWFLLLKLLSLHNCENLVPLVVYMNKVPDESISELTLKVTPTMCLRDFPLSCDECKIENFGSPQECEDHFRDFHPKRDYVCNECGEAFGTRPFQTSHCLAHLSPTFLLADYLSTQCRFYPPAGDESSPLRLEKTSFTPLGGTGKLLSGCVEEYAKPFDNHLFTKLRQTTLMKKVYLEEKRRKKNEGDDDPDYEDTLHDDDSKIQLPDLGLDHITLEIGEVLGEKEKNGLAEYFKENEDAKSLLSCPKTWLFDEEHVLEKLKIDSETYRKGNKVKFSIQCENSYASAWMGQFSTNIALPIRRELGHLDFSALFDSLPEEERVYLCHCGVICRGTSAAEHALTCFITESSGDVNLDMSDQITCLYLPDWPSDVRIHCFEKGCKTSTCSVLALQAHLLSEHSKFHPIQGAKTNNVSFSKRIHKKDYQTRLARESDAALGMKADGFLVKKNAFFPVHRSILAGYQAQAQTQSQSYHRPTPGNKGEPNLEVLPFRVTGIGKSIYECNLCRFRTDNFKFCALHLINNHADPCNACGSVFMQKVNREIHQLQNCSRPTQNPNKLNPRVSCPVCGFNDRIRYVVHHMIQTHYPMIRYHRLDGTMYPAIKEIFFNEVESAKRPQVVELDDDEISSVESGALNGVPEGVNGNADDLLYFDNPRTQFKCFMCDMCFGNKEQLEAHYKAHPEQWTNCPICAKGGVQVEIESHEAMRKHIDAVHLKVTDGKKYCTYCSRCLEKRVYSHVIYECTAIKACMICGTDKFDSIARHRTTTHGNGIMSRFECNLCHIKTFSCDYVKEHSCMSTFLPHRCNCGNGEVYIDRSAFEAHFRKHIQSTKNESKCLLCTAIIPPSKNLFVHGQQHMIIQKDTSGRRTIVLDKNLVIDEEKLEEKRQKEDAKVVKEIVRAMVREIVEERGEEWEDGESSPEDDDCLIIDPQSSTGGAQLQLPREEGDTGLPQSVTMSGYFEDDETNELGDEFSCVSAVQPTIKEITVEDEDDELAVIAQVEYPAGTLPSTVASGSRTRRNNCPKCSAKFITEKSLKYHLDTAHKFDAGGTIMEDLGIPEHTSVFICRPCCVAFKAPAQLQTHQKQHVGSNQLNCDRCSMVAYNAQLLDIHMKSHNDGRLTFSCHRCHFAYKTDSELYGHLEEKHQVPLIYFCKTCNLGSTNGLLIAEHVTSRMCAPKYQGKNIEANFGIAPASIFHYNPPDLDRYKQLVAQKAIKAIDPSLCNHRTFVAPSQTVVACLECHCLMNIASFLAHKEATGSGAEDIQYALVNHPHVLSPQRKMINLVNRMGTGKWANGTGNRTMPQVQPVVQQPRPQVVQQPRPQVVQQPRPQVSNFPPQAYNFTGLWTKLGPPPSRQTAARTPYQPLHSATRRAPSATAQISTKPINTPELNLATVLGDMLKNNGSTAQQSRTTFSASTRFQPPRVQLSRAQPTRKPQEVVLSDDEETSTPQSSNGSSHSTNKIGAPCHICHKSINNKDLLQLHELHTNGHNYFCLDCPISLPDEQAAIEHYFTVHVKKTPAREKPLVFDLKCPFHGCEFKTETLVTLRQHLDTHNLPVKSQHCSTSFSTEGHRKAHDREHEKLEEAGIEGNCCLLCGTLDVWTKRLPDFPMPISHMAIHGLRKFVMCRDCNVCFKHDAQGKKLVQHFQTIHTKELSRGSDQVQCKLCQTLFPINDLAKHAREKHYVHGFKKRSRAKEGQLIVTAGASLRVYLGLQPVYHPDDKSDID